MDDIQKEFLEKLNARKSEIERTLRRLMDSQKEYTDPAGNHVVEESDQAQREISISNIYSLIERKTQELKGIHQLIRRISKDGRFGICEECGQPIPPERLMIVPEARLCVPCQRENEHFDHMRRGLPRSPLDKQPEPENDTEEVGGLYEAEFGWMESDHDPLPVIQLDDKEG